MNLPEFLRAADAATARMTREQLAGFIHQQARQLPGERRAQFLAALREELPEEVPEEAAIPDCSGLLDILRRIAGGEICLAGELNEAYDDWYGSDENEFLIEDPHDIAGTVRRSIDAVHQAVNAGAYEDALQMAQQILELSITVEGEYTDYTDDPFDIDDIAAYGLLPDYGALLHRLFMDALVAIYFFRTGEERCAELFRLFNSYAGENALSLEDVLSASPRELPDFPTFLPQWAEYLGGKTGRTSDRLMAEASQLLEDREAQMSMARRFANTHPGLYERMLRNNPNGMEDGRLLSLGQEALREIRPDIRLRSRVALLTAACALRLNDRDEAERCWLEALRSDPTATNYLRVCVESRDTARGLEAAHGICGPYHEGRKRFDDSRLYDESESAVFRLSNSMRCSLAFLEHDFSFVQKRGMSVKEGLGWSSTFAKTGIALFLLYLYQGDTLDRGTGQLCAAAASATEFSEDRYFDGLPPEAAESGASVFWRIFRVWRAAQNRTEQEQDSLLREMERLVDLRLEGIMAANRRNYYAECAMYVAGLAEVKASRGEVSGKQEVLCVYKERYSRRRAFHQELRNFGMK